MYAATTRPLCHCGQRSLAAAHYTGATCRRCCPNLNSFLTSLRPSTYAASCGHTCMYVFICRCLTF